MAPGTSLFVFIAVHRLPAHAIVAPLMGLDAAPTRSHPWTEDDEDEQ